MYGFNVEDDRDRPYLTELATRGVGSTEDIRGFVHLSLLRGLEEWDQAISCASAIREREYRHDCLDGQDLLSFLSIIYGVDGPCHTNTALPASRRPKRLRTRRRSERRRKQKRAERQRDSPYWNEARASTPRQEGHPGEGLQGEAMTEPPSRKRKKLSEEEFQPTTTASPEQSKDEMVKQAYQENMNTIRDDEGDDYARHALFELGIPAIQALSTSDESIEPTANSRQEIMKVRKPKKALEESVNPTKPPQSETPKRKVAKSPYFAATPDISPSSLSAKSPNKKRPLRGTVSSLPFPRLDAPHFGLIQEELATDPFRLLVAVTFLVRTSGKAAIPVFRRLIEKYPTPSALANAPAADIEAGIRHLGLGNVRAATIQRFARAWVEEPPRKGVRYVVKNYQGQSRCADCSQVKRGLDARDEGDDAEDGEEYVKGEKAYATASTWEIGHITQGPYALDSWRIFCRDVLRGEAEDWNGGGREGEFQPEWMRVLPRDKELRACLRWMWMREGFQWDPDTGDKVLLSDELRRAVQERRVGYESDTGDLRILEEGLR